MTVKHDALQMSSEQVEAAKKVLTQRPIVHHSIDMDDARGLTKHEHALGKKRLLKAIGSSSDLVVSMKKS